MKTKQQVVKTKAPTSAGTQKPQIESELGEEDETSSAVGARAASQATTATTRRRNARTKADIAMLTQGMSWVQREDKRKARESQKK